MFVPLSVKHPVPELHYVVTDADVSILLHDTAHADTAEQLVQSCADASRTLPRWCCPDAFQASAHAVPAAAEPLPKVDLDGGSSILYTSGTTGRPKGVLQTHRSTMSQTRDLVAAWAWEPSDHILHYLPLHHVHGVVNKLSCPLWSGALCEFIRWCVVLRWRGCLLGFPDS